MISSLLRTLLSLAAVVVTVQAFGTNMPARFGVSSHASSSTALQFGFLKQLGLEKPDWLPDFGGEKKEEEEAAPAAAASEDVEAAAEGDSESSSE